MEETDQGSLLCEMPGMTLAIARACVNAVAHNRPLDAVAFAYRHGQLKLTEEDVIDISSQAKLEWGLDLPRKQRKDCFLCGRTLPSYMEGLCSCFEACMPGVWVDTSRACIESLYAAGMGERLVATVECRKCSTLTRYTVASAHHVLRTNKNFDEFRPHKVCKDCYTEARSSAPPPPKGKGPAVRMSLQQLAAQVAQNSDQPVA